MEQRLAGGNMTEVWRVGATVRRQAGPWTPTIHALLAHLRRQGIDWVPEPLGIDERGREILGFIEGDVPAYPLPEWVWGDHVLVEAARRLRRLHDATADFAPEHAVWQLESRLPAEVICHNDFAPHNLVFHAGDVVGAIDFDTSSPGPRLWDLAGLALRIVPITAPPDGIPRDRVLERCRLLLDSYGSDAPLGSLLEFAVARLESIADYSDAKAVTLDNPDLAEHAIGYRRDAAWLRGGLLRG